MGCNIARINSILNMDQCTIHLWHGVTKCENWLSSHGLRLWLQVVPAVFCCSQICHVELHVLIILDWSGSCGEYLESKFLAVGDYLTLFLDTQNRLRRYMLLNAPWMFEWHVRQNLFYVGARVPIGNWYYSSAKLVSYWIMTHYQGCEDWADVHLYLMCST